MIIYDLITGGNQVYQKCKARRVLSRSGNFYNLKSIPEDEKDNIIGYAIDDTTVVSNKLTGAITVSSKYDEPTGPNKIPWSAMKLQYIASSLGMPEDEVLFLTVTSGMFNKEMFEGTHKYNRYGVNMFLGCDFIDIQNPSFLGYYIPSVRELDMFLCKLGVIRSKSKETSMDPVIRGDFSKVFKGEFPRSVRLCSSSPRFYRTGYSTNNGIPMITFELTVDSDKLRGQSGYLEVILPI